MVRWLFKYGALIFLFNTVFLSIEATYTIGNQIFLGLMILFSFVLIIYLIVTKFFFLILTVLNGTIFVQIKKTPSKNWGF